MYFSSFLHSYSYFLVDFFVFPEFLRCLYSLFPSFLVKFFVLSDVGDEPLAGLEREGRPGPQLIVVGLHRRPG
jgi:hypothetical protein